MAWIIALSVVVFVLIAFLIYSYVKKRKSKSKDKQPKEKKLKLKKEKKVNKPKEASDQMNKKASYCDTVDKFLFRKEVKVFILINKILPKGYICFPKIGLETILQPIGSHDLYNSIKGKYVDFVIFKQETMKPLAVVDIFDGSIDDEQVEIDSPEIVEAIKSADLPLVSFRVKPDYLIDEIKQPLFDALKIKDEDVNKYANK